MPGVANKLAKKKRVTRAAQKSGKAQEHKRPISADNILRLNGAKQLNLYGDLGSFHAGKFGNDIASQRYDALDAACIEHAHTLIQGKKPKYIAVDLGCGRGIQGLRLALMGFTAYLYDILPVPQLVSRVNQVMPVCDLKSVQCDLRNVSTSNLPSTIDLCYSQRFIHYMKWQEALRLLSGIWRKMSKGGRVYVSASGLHSEIGEAHPHAGLDVRERFARLDPAMAEKHNIKVPICLYSEEELRALLKEAGFSTINTMTSEFGNVKGVFEK